MWNFYEFYRRLRSVDEMAFDMNKVKKAKARLQGQPAPAEPAAQPPATPQVTPQEQPPAANAPPSLKDRLRKKPAAPAVTPEAPPAEAPAAEPTGPPSLRDRMGKPNTSGEPVAEPGDPAAADDGMKAKLPAKRQLKAPRLPRDDRKGDDSIFIRQNNFLRSNYGNPEGLAQLADKMGMEFQDQDGTATTAQELLAQGVYPQIYVQGIDSESAMDYRFDTKPPTFPLIFTDRNSAIRAYNTARKQVIKRERGKTSPWYHEEKGEALKGRRVGAAKIVPSLDDALESSSHQKVLDTLARISDGSDKIVPLSQIIPLLHKKILAGGTERPWTPGDVEGLLKGIIGTEQKLRKQEAAERRQGGEEVKSNTVDYIVPAYYLATNKQTGKKAWRPLPGSYDPEMMPTDQLGIQNLFKTRGFDPTAADVEQADLPSGKQHHAGDMGNVNALPLNPDVEGPTMDDPQLQQAQAAAKAKKTDAEQGGQFNRDSLVQQGMEGVLKALDNYDQNKVLDIAVKILEADPAAWGDIYRKLDLHLRKEKRGGSAEHAAKARELLNAVHAEMKAELKRMKSQRESVEWMEFYTIMEEYAK